MTFTTNPENETFEVPKIRFCHREIERHLDKLVHVIYWMLYYKNADYKDICKFLSSVSSDIVMKYNPREPVKVSVGDIVKCTFARGIHGEVSGYVHAIICDIDEERLFYTLPMTKYVYNDDLNRYLPFKANIDCDYTDPMYTGGTILLKRGRYIPKERIVEVLGTVRPQFFNKLLEALQTTFKFSPDAYGQSPKSKRQNEDILEECFTKYFESLE